MGATQYFAKGGCFLAGTMIGTPDGDVAIETLKAGDTVVSYNEATLEKEDAVIGAIDVLERDHYYIINGVISTTGEHPFYTTQGIKEVKDLKLGDKLVGRYDKEIEIITMQVIHKEVTVYNLLDVVPNHNYYAGIFLVHNKGGSSCFLAGTRITGLSGYINVEDVKAGDRIWTYNESTGITEVGQVQELDVLSADSYFIINDNVKVTGEHPFYVLNESEQLEIKLVKDLEIGDLLYTSSGTEEISTIEEIDDHVAVYNLINVRPNHNYYANGYLVHNKGGSSGGRSSSSSSKSSSSSSKSSSTSSKNTNQSKSSTPSKPATPKKGVSKATPGSKVKTADGKEVQSSAKQPTNKSFTQSRGVVGDNGFQPRYQNGYAPPAGSVVYQDRGPSALDYFFIAYLFNSNNSARPENQQEVVVQPDGKEVQVKPVQEGVDGLLIINWIILIIFIGAIIGGIVWLVNKKTGGGKSSYA